MQEEDIVRKIQKAMRLADGGGTEAESQNALLMAQKMAMKHGIDIKSFGDLSDEEIRGDIIYHEIKETGLSSWWREKLMVIIAKNFKVNSYRSWEYKKIGKNYYRLILVGFEEEVKIAAEVFSHAEKSIQHHARTYISKMGKRIKSSNKNKYKNEYIKGYLDGLERKFDDQVRKEEWALVLVLHPAVKETTAHMESYDIASPDIVSSGQNAYHKGFKQGRDYNYPVGAIK